MTLPSFPLSLVRAGALAALLASGAAAQEEVAEDAAGGSRHGLFATGVLDGLESGDSLVFRHERIVEPDDSRLPDIDGTAEVSVAEADGGGKVSHVALVAGGRTRPVPQLPADAGHPLLLVFLESTVRTIAEATGGSPFYIRNRIRETIWEGGAGRPVELRYQGEAVKAEEVVYRPFADDPNRARMGGFADLELRFLVSEAVPGHVALLAMQAPAGQGAPEVSETMMLEGVDAEERS